MWKVHFSRRTQPYTAYPFQSLSFVTLACCPVAHIHVAHPFADSSELPLHRCIGSTLYTAAAHFLTFHLQHIVFATAGVRTGTTCRSRQHQLLPTILQQAALPTFFSHSLNMHMEVLGLYSFSHEHQATDDLHTTLLTLSGIGPNGRIRQIRAVCSYLFVAPQHLRTR